MAYRILTTPLGSPIIFDDLAVTKSNKIPIITMVESLVTEFDQEKYEEFLTCGSTSTRFLWKCQKISTNLALNEAKKTTVQGDFPKDSPDLSSLKREAFSPKIQGSGSFTPKIYTGLNEKDRNPPTRENNHSLI